MRSREDSSKPFRSDRRPHSRKSVSKGRRRIGSSELGSKGRVLQEALGLSHTPQGAYRTRTDIRSRDSRKRTGQSAVRTCQDFSPPAGRCTRLLLAFRDYRKCADYLFPAEATPSIKMTRIINAESRGEFIVFGNARFETATKGRDD